MRSDEQPSERPALRALSPRTIALGGSGLVVLGVTAAWLLLSTGATGVQLDAIRTAGTLVVGAGGGIALWLAARRQRSTELDLLQKYEAHRLATTIASSNEQDAVERRITELYGKAADQLGSDKAPVRLAGLHAMERLAQDTPRLRQTIVDVLSAYLRMPYAADGEAGDGTSLQRDQERQVRLTAQRILVTHLTPENAFWPDITLNLTGATLLDLDLSRCHLRSASFDEARFAGRASFVNTRFEKSVSFQKARFTGKARFALARCVGPASFTLAHFTGNASFEQAEFGAHATFEAAEFDSHANFGGARFEHFADFRKTMFRKTASFDGTRFDGRASFGNDRYDGASFEAHSYFRGARFADHTLLCGARFTDTAVFDDAVFHAFTGFHHAEFNDSAIFSETKFLAESRFRCTKFTGSALFGGSEFAHANFDDTLFCGDISFADVKFTGESSCHGARVRLDIGKSYRIWPPGWLVAEPPTPEVEILLNVEGRWGRLFDS